MKKKPLVSVIMPAYNAEIYIEEAIESILNQTYKNFELIILNDASTDSTGKITEEYAKKDKRVKVVHNKKNLYISKNRNKGIKMAKGKYIVWQDADDISIPGRLELQVALMESNPKIGIAGGYLQSFNDKGNLDIRKYEQDDKLLRKSMFKFSPVAQPSAIIRKECFDQFGYYDENTPPAEDLDMSFKIGTKYKFANIPQVLIKYRESSTNATNTKLKKMLRVTLDTRKKYSKGYGYKMNLWDYLAYFLTWSVQVLPASVTIVLFKIARSIVKTFKL